ncbi:histone deacetylase 8 [Hysterangium stoloniferum]|nr:histone deacetylase 8 [Hysterangium stoloniferum]
MPARVTYIVSEDLVKASSQLPSNKRRSALVHSLVQSFGLLSRQTFGHLRILRPTPATRKQLLAYHEQEYIDDILSSASTSKDARSEAHDRPDLLGLEDDCPPFVGLSQYVQLVAGASLTAAAVLKQDDADISINWDGGRHHAQKGHAAGFCYVADCVLSILALKQPPKSRIMYLDLDLHFSDAVSQAFAGSSSGQILTLSIHHSAPGFYPPSPLSSLPDSDTSDPYTLSLPLRHGASDKTFHRVWQCVDSVKNAFSPEYVVVQCGVDGLAGDPCGTWNWSLGSSDGSFGWCLSQVLGWNCKTLLLGGGGYNSPNVARAWSYVTSIALGQPLPLEADIPDHNGFPSYEPSFTLDIPAGNMRDENTDEYLEHIEQVYSQVVGRLGAKTL